jgi:GTPase SAR1 family protein
LVLLTDDFVCSFFENIEAIFSSNYSPSADDILRARLKTAGHYQEVYAKNNIPFKVIDPAGMRSEQRKWIYHYPEAKGVVFVVSINEYNQTMYEDEKVNRMHESLEVWERIVHLEELKNKPVILIFNKYDLFKQKITQIDLNVCFPEYNKEPKNALEAQHFILQKYLAKAQDARKEVQCYFINSLDCEEVRKVWTECLKSFTNSPQL